VTPFHLRIRPPPTAQALPAERAATPLREAGVAGHGLSTRVQVLPFQRMIKVSGTPRALALEPAAHALAAEVPATAVR
jgi:hypothetical protein